MLLLILLKYFELDHYGIGVLEYVGGPTLRKYFRNNYVCLADRLRLAAGNQKVARRQQVADGQVVCDLNGENESTPPA